MTSDNKMTIDQFTRQAAGYASAATIRNDQVIQRMVYLADLDVDDTTLDVACGPGLIVCAFASRVGHAAGIDLTPAMLDQARRLQSDSGLSNITWTEGDVSHLPYADGKFSVVTSRYAFHHFRDPLAVLHEMVRVAKPGGTILIADSAPAAEKADAFNAMERLRDPSHVRALTVEQWISLFVAAGLAPNHVESFRLAGDLDSLLARSYPNPGDELRVRQMFESSLNDDFLDVQPRRDCEKIVYGFPILIFRSRKAERSTVTAS